MARGKATDTFYEVRLDSWNCSCAAFAAAGMGLLVLDDEEGLEVEKGGDGDEDDHEGVVESGEEEEEGVGGGWRADEGDGREGGENDGDLEDTGARMRQTQSDVLEERFKFGGTATRPNATAPVCKHILAAAMAKNLPDFMTPPGRDGRDWRGEISGNERAGWAAGWRDRG
jgi:hypothetical protein